MSEMTADVASNSPNRRGAMAEDGLGYSRHYAQRIRDLGKTSKESWIKRLWNHMFGNVNQNDMANENGEIGMGDTLQEHINDTKDGSTVRGNSSEKRTSSSWKEKEVRFKESSTRHSRDETSGNMLNREDNHSAFSKSSGSLRPFSAHEKNLDGLPVQLINSPYLPTRERGVFFKVPKVKEGNKDVKSRYLNQVSKSMTALRSQASRPEVNSGNSHRQLHPYLSQHREYVKPRPTRDVFTIQLEKRAKVIADKAIKSSKVFTCDAPYPVDSFVRISLRKRGWVEKFGPRATNCSTTDASPMKLEINNEHDFQKICDQGFPKPWEEDHGVYAVMSRFVQRYPAKFIWGGKSVNNLILKSDVVVNHFPKAKYFSSKVLLATSLRDLAWHNNTDSMTFFPRCYLLNEDDKADIVEDFQMTACMALLKLVIDMYDTNKENHLCPTNGQMTSHDYSRQEDDDGLKGDSDVGLDDSEQGLAVRLSGRKRNKQEKFDVSDNDQMAGDQLLAGDYSSSDFTHDAQDTDTSQDTHDTGEDSGAQCAADIVDDIDDKIISSKIGQVKVVPDLKSKSRDRKGGIVPVKAVDWAIQQCLRYISAKNHEDIDSKYKRGLFQSQWNQLLFWFYQVSQDGATVSLSDSKLEDCENALESIKDVWPQYDLDGTRNIWIIKPGDKSKGIGISFCDNLDEIFKVMKNPATQDYIVQKYIERPLLIYKCKFDIRQWFLVTDWLPLTVWFYTVSYLRICSQEFSYESMHESVHLSNVAVQENYFNGKRSDKLPDNNFMTSEEFKIYLSEVGGEGMWEDKIYPGMKEAVINTLVATQEVTDHRKSAFELYGADFMMSEDYTPWLLEVNSSPGMLPSSIEKAKLCSSVIEDTIKVVLDYRENSGCETGRFELIHQDMTNPNTRGVDSKLILEGQKIKKPDLQRFTLIDQKAMKVQKYKEEKSKEKKHSKMETENQEKDGKDDVMSSSNAQIISTNNNNYETSVQPADDERANVILTPEEKMEILGNVQEQTRTDGGVTLKDKDKTIRKNTLRSSIVEIYGGRHDNKLTTSKTKLRGKSGKN